MRHGLNPWNPFHLNLKTLKLPLFLEWGEIYSVRNNLSSNVSIVVIVSVIYVGLCY